MWHFLYDLISIKLIINYKLTDPRWENGLQIQLQIQKY